MSDGVKLLCRGPGASDPFVLQREPVPSPRTGDVVVRVEACSVNPIDAKRAQGYGRRLLGLKGAGRFPLVLGNDLVGTVETVGAGVTRWRAGDRVVGLVPTGKGGGTHASHVAVGEALLRPAVDGVPAERQAVLPYTFTTLWLALRGAGLTPDSARGKEILVHGASGGLGRLALPLLVRWGASVTAICGPANVDACRSLGAGAVWDRTQRRLEDLPARFDAVLNFGSWVDDAVLAGRLRDGATGHATTVHPLLENFDRHGWLGGAWRSRADFRRGRAAARATGARYSWTVFRPDGEALDRMHGLLLKGVLDLPVGIDVPLSGARGAFEHVARQGRGRAVLRPLR